MNRGKLLVKLAVENSRENNEDIQSSWSHSTSFISDSQGSSEKEFETQLEGFKECEDITTSTPCFRPRHSTLDELESSEPYSEPISFIKPITILEGEEFKLMVPDILKPEISNTPTELLPTSSNTDEKPLLEQDSPNTKVARYLMESEITSAQQEAYFKPKTNTDPKLQIATEDMTSIVEDDDFNKTSLGSEYIPSSVTSNSDSEPSNSNIYSDDTNLNTPTNDMCQPGADGCLMESETIQVQEELPASSSKQNSGLVSQITSDNLIDESNKRRYIKSASARERPTICPICYDDVITHFTRHLFKRHSDDKQVKLIKSLKPRSTERLGLVSTLRKQGYFHLKIEKDILNPVKPSKLPSVEYYICQFCLGYYKKSLLYKHVKVCKSKPDTVTNPGKNCLSKSQTFMALASLKNQEFLKNSQVLEIMRPDEISAACKSDPLICLYGEALLSKHKRQQIVTVVSNKIREMARLTIALKSIHPEINGLFDLMSPDMFQALIMATKLISGYDEATKSFKSPSLALHMGTNLKMVCDIAYKLVLENRKFPNIKWTDRNQTKTNIKDLKKTYRGTLNLQERQWEKLTTLPSTSDIQLLQGYIHNLSEKAFHELNNNINIQSNYKILTECVLALTVMFNRKRVGDVQYLKIETYNKDWSAVNQDTFIESLTPLEKSYVQKI
ncbi:hypothetical protein NQ318_022175 [Aromia moschata]|uniref:Uncharacterized protein n=1 Tax=Aromia moschata TaxID=1265417 RepID=A0AAV8Z7U6_9CUCU|nr:hypothetical protein NQ318_022175 [Aromia moschata]